MKRLFTLAIVAMIASLTFAQAPVQKKAAVKSQIEKVAGNAQMQKALEAKAAMKAKAQAAQETSGSVLRKAATRPVAAAMQMKAPRTLTTLAAKAVTPAKRGMQYKKAAEAMMKTRMNKGLMGRKSFAPFKAQAAAGDFLIVNVDGGYIGGGNDWGTHATLLGKPQWFTLAGADGAYTLDSHQSNGGENHFLGTGLYCDAAAYPWSFNEVEAGVYTLSADGQYLVANGMNQTLSLAAVESASKWKLVSMDEVIAGMAVATEENPVDVTAFIKDPELKRNGNNMWHAWTITSFDGTANAANFAEGQGGNKANCGESYKSSNGFKAVQTITLPKAGKYTLSAQAFYRIEGGVEGQELPYLFVGDQKSNFPERKGTENSMPQAYEQFLQKNYTVDAISFETVEDNETVEIGFAGAATSMWNIFGELELMYLGNGEEDPYAEVDLDLTATEYSEEYYDEDGDWFCAMVAQGIPFRFDIVTNNPAHLNGTYTWDQMDHSYSWAGTNSQGWTYSDAIFTVNGDGTEAEAYVTLEDGTKVHISYVKPEAPEITNYETIEFSLDETDLNDMTSAGLLQISGDNGEQYASIALFAEQVAGTYTIDDVYMTYTNLYLSADDYEGVLPFDLNATVTEEGATVIYDAYNGTEYTLIFHFKEEGGDNPAGDVVVTKDANGIITNVTGGEARVYTRNNPGLYYTSSGISYQSGSVNVIVDGNDFYIQNPICGATYSAWVKGTLSADGTTLTVPTSQPLAYVANYNAFIELTYGDFTGSTFTRNTDNDIVYTVSDNTLTLTGADAEIAGTSVNFETVLGDFWSDDDTWQGHGEWSSVLTYDPNAVAPSTELVTPPAGTTEYEWYLNGTQVSNDSETPIQNQKIGIVIYGTEIYLKGVFEDFPESWIKGDMDTQNNTITFAKGQYLGNYAGQADIWFMGTDGEGLTDATATLSEYHDAFTFNADLLANAANDRIYYLEWIANAVVSSSEVTYEEPVITEMTAALPYVNSFDTEAEQAEAAIYDANGDGKTFTFANDTKTGSTTARYAYSTKADGDDYVVFPGLSLKAGTSYKVSVDARSYSNSYPERLEIVAGTVAKASELTIPVLEATDIASGDYLTLTANFTPETDGVYYIALHAISDPDQFYLYTDNFSVAENDPLAPAAVTDLVAVADPEAALKATVKFTVPTTTVEGAEMSGYVQYVLTRDGEEVKVGTVAPGTPVEYVDETIPAPATVTYGVKIVVGEHVSDLATVKVYVGEDTPDDVENLAATDLNGKVGLTWDAPVDGVNGGIIIPANLKYNVYPVEMVEFWGMQFPSIDFENPYMTGLTETNATVNYDTNEGEQGYTYFGVTAENTAGESMGAMGATLTGAPYELPVVEEFPNGSLTYWWGVDYDDAIDAADGGLGLTEDGQIAFQAPVAGWIELYSGKIALAGADKPQMSFLYSGSGSMKATVYGPAKSKEVTLTPAEAAQTAVIDLAELASEPWVRLTLRGEFAEAGEAYFDNFIVMNAVENDLDIAVSAPATVVAGKTATVKATVTNKGTAEASAYAVQFSVNDEVVETISDVTSLKFFKSAEYSFSLETSIFAEAGDLTVKAEVVYANDAVEANNADEAVVSIVASTATPVETVTAAETAEGVKIDWTVAANTPQEITEDFESYEGNTVYADGESMGDWLAVDLGQNYPYTWNGVDTWTYGDPFAFGVMNFVTTGLKDGSYSGEQAVVMISEYDASGNGVQSDKYMISPELPGIAQTVSFQLMVATAQYGAENIEVMASSTDTNVASFTKVASISSTDTDWTEYTANLPEGTKYFAIHYCSNDVFAVFIDDVKYTAGGSDATGFNVYVDEVQVASVAADARTYTATNVPAGNHKFSVTAVYGNNESAPVSATLATAINSVAATSAATEAYTISGIRMDAKNLKRGVYVINGKKVVK